MSTSIEQSFKKALEAVEKQIEQDGAAKTEDVEKLQMWQAMLSVKHEAEREKRTKIIG
jgi:hypothetical protein